MTCACLPALPAVWFCNNFACTSCTAWIIPTSPTIASWTPMTATSNPFLSNTSPALISTQLSRAKSSIYRPTFGTAGSYSSTPTTATASNNYSLRRVTLRAQSPTFTARLCACCSSPARAFCARNVIYSRGYLVLQPVAAGRLLLLAMRCR